MPTQLNQNSSSAKPVVLCIAGLDPTGGAGIQADIETLFSLGCHAAAVVSVLTVQTSVNVQSLSPVDADLVIAQAQAVLQDMNVACIKLGLLPSCDIIRAVHHVVGQASGVPVVLDPVLIAGGGFAMSDSNTTALMRELLLPRVTVITPNIYELQTLIPEAKNLDEAAAIALSEGCEAVLLTGTHADSIAVENCLYLADGSVTVKSWPRLPQTYHGSGCTLASAVAAGLAKQADVATASANAQEFTWQALNQASKLGKGQWFPNRHLS